MERQRRMREKFSEVFAQNRKLFLVLSKCIN